MKYWIAEVDGQRVAFFADEKDGVLIDGILESEDTIGNKKVKDLPLGAYESK